MDPSARREEILQLLQLDIKPMSATNLADRFGVSRQIIVGDIALLRAGGVDIIATARGYILNKDEAAKEELKDSYVLACCHDKVQLEEELFIIADNGGVLVNVVVEHPLYGNITQELNIENRFDASNFVNKVTMTGGTLLSSLTGGVHLHTIRCKDPDSYRRILVALKQKNILYTK